MVDDKKLKKILEQAERELKQADTASESAKLGTKSLTDITKKAVVKQDEKKK